MDCFKLNHMFNNLKMEDDMNTEQIAMDRSNMLDVWRDMLVDTFNFPNLQELDAYFLPIVRYVDIEPREDAHYINTKSSVMIKEVQNNFVANGQSYTLNNLCVIHSIMNIQTGESYIVTLEDLGKKITATESNFQVDFIGELE